MDSSISMDVLNDTPTLPELSFEDLLDVSPVKSVGISDSENEIIEIADYTVIDDILNTPSSKKKLQYEDSLNTPAPKKQVQMLTQVLTTPKAVLKKDEIKIMPIRSMPATGTVITQIPITRPLTSITSTQLKTTIAQIAPKTSSIAIVRPTTNTTTTTVNASTSLSSNVLPVKSVNHPSILLNSKNVLPKTATTLTSNQLIKITPKVATTTITTQPSTAATSSPSTQSTSNLTAVPPGKTAIKTMNGQIIYLQKSAVRLQPSSSSSSSSNTVTPVSSTATSVTTTKVATSNVSVKSTNSSITSSGSTSANKTVAIQVIRNAAGKFVPVKTGATPTGIKNTATSKTTLTLSPTQLATKKIITSGGQFIIKTPMKAVTTTPVTTIAKPTLPSSSAPKIIKVQKLPTIRNLSSTLPAVTSSTGIKFAAKPIITTAASAIASTNAASTKTMASISSSLVSTVTTTMPISTTTTITTTSTPSSKIFVQGPNGKQILVPQQSLIKLSPKTVTSSALNQQKGQLHAIKIQGKPGIQYVRVMGNQKLNTRVEKCIAIRPENMTTSAIGEMTVSTTSTTSTTTTTSTVAPKSIISSSPVTSTTGVKILNSMPHKFTMVRTSGIGGSGPTKFVITQSPKKDGSANNSTVTTVGNKVKTVVFPSLRRVTQGDLKKATIGTVTNASGQIATIVGAPSFMRKTKISHINSEIQRITGRDAGDDHHDNNGEPKAKKTTIVRTVGTTSSGNRILVMPRHILRTKFATSQGNTNVLHRITVPSTLNSNNNNKNSINNNNSNIKALLAANEQPKKLYSILKQSSTNSNISGSGINNENEKKPLFNLNNNQNFKVPVHVKEEDSFQKHFIQQNKKLSSLDNHVPPVPVALTKAESNLSDADFQKAMIDDVGGSIRRKHCNCSKSQCLKLYCDCFANGEFCHDCTCKDCFNNLQYEDERQRAIRMCLERNPSAFKPKITHSRDQGDMRLHNKGCNCKRSGCLKNYCECYEAKIPCSNNCKCVGCRNIEDRDFDMDLSDPNAAALKRSFDNNNDVTIEKRARIDYSDDSNSASVRDKEQQQSADAQKPYRHFITHDVMEATIQCMISQADECARARLSDVQTEAMVMEELGRCLIEIIDFSIHNTENSFSTKE